MLGTRNSLSLFRDVSNINGLSQWPHGLRRGSVVSCLQGLRVRIPPGYGCLWLVGVLCCQVEISASGRSLFQRSPTECGVSECDREASIIRRPWPIGAVAPWKRKSKINNYQHHWRRHWEEDVDTGVLEFGAPLCKCWNNRKFLC